MQTRHICSGYICDNQFTVLTRKVSNSITRGRTLIQRGFCFSFDRLAFLTWVFFIQIFGQLLTL